MTVCNGLGIILGCAGHKARRKRDNMVAVATAVIVTSAAVVVALPVAAFACSGHMRDMKLISTAYRSVGLLWLVLQYKTKPNGKNCSQQDYQAIKMMRI